MNLKDAYQKAFQEEVEILIAKGKIQLLSSLEDVTQDLTDGVSKALLKGAEYSDTPVDDAFVVPAVAFFKPKVDKHVDSIDGVVG